VNELPPEAERLLSANADEFVAERKRVAAELRSEGRDDEARVVAGLRKPSGVVLAVNRAARDRPKAAEKAASAALRVRKTQLSGEQEAYRLATTELDNSLDLLAEVALAHVAPRAKSPSDAMRRRVRDLLRSAVADDETRDALVRGVLTDESEAAGFAPFEGMPLPRVSKKRAADEPERRSDRRERQTREKKLRGELREAERALREAERSLEQAVRTRDEAERALEAARARLEQL
jgi:hypothetical protein